MKNNTSYSIEKLVAEYSNYIKTILSKVTNLNFEDKEELLQDVIFNVYQKLDTLSQDIIKPYIATTTKNLIINKVKKSSSFSSDSLDELQETIGFEVQDNNSDLISNIITKEKLDLINNVIDSFTSIDKNIFLSYYYENLKIKEISRKYKVSQISVKVKLHRMRNILKSSLIKGGYNYD